MAGSTGGGKPVIALLSAEDFEDIGCLRQGSSRRAHDDIRAAAFAEGFEAGRSYAQQQGRDAQARDLERISESLQDLAFTAVEARAQVLASVVPLLRAITDVVLPAAASAGLRDLVVSEVSVLADRIGARALTLEMGHDAAAALAGHAGLPPDLAISEHAGLGPLEIRIRASGAERHVDLDAALAAIGRAIADFSSLSTEMQSHG